MGVSVDVEDRLLTVWHQASKDLGLRLEAPFSVALASGATVVGRLLLRDFGAVNGMLIVSEYAALSPHAEDLVRAGFGYSCLTEPTPTEGYDRETFVEMLRDWGWSGANHLRPSWLEGSPK